MSDFDSLDFQACHDAMRRAGVTFSPAEAHAIAVGMFAGNIPDPEGHWFKAVYADLDPNNALVGECRNLLDEVFDVAQAQSVDAEFGLQLFLPPSGLEYTPSLGLRDWAQGFLYGFGLAGNEAAEKLSAEGQEALRDFYEIGQLDVEGTDQDEEEQAALMEIEEYMRVAAMLIHEDMHRVMPNTEAPSELH